MGGLRSKRGLILSGLLLATGVIYAGVSLPSFNYVQADTAPHLQERRAIFKYGGRARRASPHVGSVVIDMEVDLELPNKQDLQQLVHHTEPQNILHHPRVHEWCHRPDSTYTGLEGTPVKGFKLASVLVLTTPGHTVHIPPQDDLHSCQLWEFLSRFSDDKLSSYQEMLSIHKNMMVEKGPFKVFDSAPFLGQCKSGELSPLGVSQHIKLGEFVRKAYFTKLKTLKTLPRDTVAMASCVKEQSAYQSTMAFLHGLLSEKQFIKAGIHKIHDNLCNDQNGLSCKCQVLTEHNDFIADAYRAITNNPGRLHAKSNLAYVDASQATSDMIAKTLRVLNGISDICQTNGNICGNGGCTDISIQSVEQVFRMLDRGISNLTLSLDFFANARLYSHPFLVKAVSLLMEPKQDFTLYTIKEFLFTNILVSLGIPVHTLPPPASRIAIEVHERPKNHGAERERVIRVLVNGRDFTPYMTACAKDFRPYCNLMLLQDLKIYNYDLACGN